MLIGMANRTPTNRRAPTPAPAPTAKKGQFNVRLDASTHDALLAWLDRLNKGRRIPLTQSDIVRGVIQWAIDHEPAFEKK